jgi:hypothetical protein
MDHGEPTCGIKGTPQPPPKKSIFGVFWYFYEIMIMPALLNLLHNPRHEWSENALVALVVNAISQRVVDCIIFSSLQTLNLNQGLVALPSHSTLTHSRSLPLSLAPFLASSRPVCPSLYISAFLSPCLSVCLSLPVSVCLFLCLFRSVPLSLRLCCVCRCLCRCLCVSLCVSLKHYLLSLSFPELPTLAPTSRTSPVPGK